MSRSLIVISQTLFIRGIQNNDEQGLKKINELTHLISYQCVLHAIDFILKKQNNKIENHLKDCSRMPRIVYKFEK